MVTAAWVLALMIGVHPKSPNVSTFPRSAEAIARVSNASPLFEGPTGPEKTATALVALGEFESGLQPDAEGDCVDHKTRLGVASHLGRCPAGSSPHSFCEFQINETNLPGFKTTKAEIVSDIDVCTDIAIKLLHGSFTLCKGLPVDDRMANYASGRGVCAGIVESRHRMKRAEWLFKNAKRYTAPEQ